MSKQIKHHSEWLESLGYSASVWLGGDWHQPLHLLSKLLATQLSERRPLDNAADVSFKISYDSMCLLADETLGVPCLVTEKDLMIQYPNLFLAQLVQLVAIKHAIDHVDPKEISATSAPRLVFEARNGMDAQFPRCPSCHEHVFFLERTIVEKVVWHRQCFKCVDCEALLKPGGFKKSKIGYECIAHGVRKILDEKPPIRTPRPKIAPPPVPMISAPQEPKEEGTSGNQHYESLEIICSDEVKKVKPAPPPKPKHLCSPKPPTISTEECSSDSGISFSSSGPTYDTIDEIPGAEVKEAVAPMTPVAPPRPKRASMLLTAGISPPLPSPSGRSEGSIRSPSPNGRAVPQPKPRNSATPTTRKERPKSAYPGSLCPFDEESAEDGKVNFEYDESKNPFADSDDEEEIPVPAPRTTMPASLLPGESDRPKFLPPPPPMETSTSPERVSEESEFLSAQEKLKTLRLSRKKKRAPLPPSLVQRRKIVFTEKQCLDDSSTIYGKIKKLDEEIKKSELEGKKLEMELLFLITTNPKDWYKLPRTEEYVCAILKLLDVLREQAYLQYSWRESFLNEIHSETEYLLRCLFEKDLQDECSAHREKQLTSLLVFIIDEKAKLSESYMDAEDRSRESSLVRKEHKKKTFKLRMAVLSKKLKSKKN